jgi:hypothetical protein
MTEGRSGEAAQIPGCTWRQATSSAVSAMPIVIGVPRSGTTLLRLMLDAHSQLAMTSETYFLFAVIKQYWSGELKTPEQLLSVVTSTPTWNDLGISKAVYLERLQSLEPFSVSQGLRTLYEMYAHRFEKPRWGDKTPRYSIILASIEHLLPEARFIHIVRDGRDVALSLRSTWFAPSQDMADLARYWKSQVEQARAVGAKRKHYLEVRYEHLVHQARSTLEQICPFIDLPFEEGMESYHQSAERRLSDLNPYYNRDGSIKVSRESRQLIHQFAKQPPNSARVGRWRRDMPREEQDAFNHVAGDLLRELGYD